MRFGCPLRGRVGVRLWRIFDQKNIKHALNVIHGFVVYQKGKDYEAQ